MNQSPWYFVWIFQGWEAGAGQSRVFLAPWSRSRLKKKKQEPESLWKKDSGAGTVKKLAYSSPLLVDEKHKEIVLLLLLLSNKNVRSRSRLEIGRPWNLPMEFIYKFCKKKF